MRLSVSIGSDVEIRVGTRDIPLQTRHERAIVARLVTIGGKSILRSRLANEHWPESGDQKAGLSLRQRLHRIKKALPEYLEVDREWVAIKNFEVIIQTDADHKSLLSQLDFEWVRRYRLARFGLIHYDPTDVEQPSDKSVLHQNTLEDWFRDYVYRCEPVTFPYSGKFSELWFRSEQETDDKEIYAMWAAGASYAAIHGCHRAFCLELALSSARIWQASPSLIPYAALAFENAANAAHNDGHYLDCLNYLVEARRCYLEIGANENQLRMKFKFHRVQLDMGLQAQGMNGLARLFNQKGRELPAHVRKLICDNLIFAFANENRGVDAESAYQFSTKHASMRNLESQNALQEVNIAVKYLNAGDLKSAASALLCYQESTFNPLHLGDSSLFWTRAIEVLAASGDFYHTSIAYSLLQSDCALTKRAISPCNQIRLHERTMQLFLRSDTDQWLKGQQDFQILSRIGVHESVICGLQMVSK